MHCDSVRMGYCPVCCTEDTVERFGYKLPNTTLCISLFFPIILSHHFVLTPQIPLIRFSFFFFLFFAPALARFFKMGWQMHRNVPSDAALKGYDDEVAARDNEIRRPAQEVFVISDEAYEHMQKRNSQRYRWDIVNIKEIRRRNTFTLAMLLQLLEEKFKSFTDNGELFEQVALGLCRRIPSDFLLYCFLDSMSPEKISHGHYSFAYNAENINDFGKRELSHWYSNEDIYSVFKAISLKVD